MSDELQLFRINPENRQSDRIEEVDFARLGFQERRDIQEWVASNPGILGDDLLIIGKEFSDFDRTNERLDLLAVDLTGRLVVIELKRDDSGADAHWQAIKYASYLQQATADKIIRVAAEYWDESEDDAASRLLQYLGADDLSALNNSQRIILASHRFAPEVTSAALWLNKNAPNAPDLVTCIRLTPYQDTQAGSLYLQATTIIPVPGVEGYLVDVGPRAGPERGRGSGSFGAKLSATFARNRNDEVSQFLQKVGRLATDGLPDGIKPDRVSRWAGIYHGLDWEGVSGRFRYYHLWYSHRPWSNHKLSYRVHLSEEAAEAGQWSAYVRFVNDSEIEIDLGEMEIQSGQFFEWESKVLTVPMGTDTLNDEYAARIADTLRVFIEQITPIVTNLGNETGEVAEL